MRTIFLFSFLIFIFSCSKNKTKIDQVMEITRDNAKINYNVYGKGDTVLLFVHGSYIDQTYWKAQVDYFSPHYRVVTFDLPGHGKSGRGRAEWTLSGFADDVTTVIKELKLKNVILIGHSMGGDINLIAATSHPEHIIGFIAIDIFKNAATPLPPEYQQQVETIKENLKKDFVKTNEEYAQKMLVTQQTPPEVTERVMLDYRNAYEPMGSDITSQIFELYKTEQALLPKLKFKLHLINVDYMPTNEEPLKKYAGSGYEIHHMKGTSHYPMIENPDELNKQLQYAIDPITAEKNNALLLENGN